MVNIGSEFDPVLGGITNGIAPASHDLPELFGVTRISITIADSDNRDRILLPARVSLGHIERVVAAHAGKAAEVTRVQTGRPTGASSPTENAWVNSSNRSPALLERSGPDLEGTDFHEMVNLVAIDLKGTGIRHELIVDARSGGFGEFAIGNVTPFGIHECRRHKSVLVVEEMTRQFFAVWMADRK